MLGKHSNTELHPPLFDFEDKFSLNYLGWPQVLDSPASVITSLLHLSCHGLLMTSQMALPKLACDITAGH